MCTYLHGRDVTSIGPYWFLYTMAICGVIYYLTFNLVGKWSYQQMMPYSNIIGINSIQHLSCCLFWHLLSC